MNAVAARWIVGLFASMLLVNVASADTMFMKAVKEKYDFKIVSCNTCHASGLAPGGAPVGKGVRNDFGKLFEPALAAKGMKAKLKAIAAAKGDAKKLLQESAMKDFLEALAGVEAMTAKDGKTYGEKLKAGDIEGVKLKQ